MNSTLRILALALVAIGLASCKKEAPPPAPPPAAPAPAPAPAPVPVAVSAVSLGSAVGADKKVSAAKDAFDKKDTIYAAIDTTGAGNAALKARWTYIGKDGKTVPVKEDSMQIVTAGPATNEFHVSKPDGWPAGNYQVEILLNDQVVQSKKYSVK